jgi:hypothetical protein
MPKQLGAPTYDVIDADDAWTGDLNNRLPEQLFTVLDRMAAQIVTIEVQEVEREIGEPIRSVPSDGVVKVVDTCDTALVGYGDFAVQDNFAPAGQQFPERDGNSDVRSCPFREISFNTPLPFRMATIRWPSYLTSCSQPSPSGGRAAGDMIARRISRGSGNGTAAGGERRFCMDVG